MDTLLGGKFLQKGTRVETHINNHGQIITNVFPVTGEIIFVQKNSDIYSIEIIQNGNRTVQNGILKRRKYKSLTSNKLLTYKFNKNFTYAEAYILSENNTKSIAETLELFRIN